MGLRRCVRRPFGNDLTILRWAELQTRNAIGQYEHPLTRWNGQSEKAELRAIQAKTWFLV